MKLIGHNRSLVETGVCGAVLVCLLAVAVGVLVRQARFNPAVRVASRAWSGALAEPVGLGAEPVQAQAEGFSRYAPPGLVEFGPLEQFDEDTLSDKIDGKADLYLSSGFRQLRCQRFALAGQEDAWFEWFVYDMGALPHAFAVYSIQRRPDATQLELTEFAYATKNAVYFVCGQFYIEAVAAEPSEPLTRAMLEMARNFVTAMAPGPMHLAELELFPAENMVPHSQALQVATAFGFEKFRNVFTAKYDAGSERVLAYLTVLGEPQEAANLAQEYYRFLIANGGRAVELASPLSSAKMVTLLDSYELVFSHGNIVGGVHAAQSKEAAAEVAAKLLSHIAGKSGAKSG